MLFDCIIYFSKCWLRFFLVFHLILVFFLFYEIPFILEIQPSDLHLCILFAIFRLIVYLFILLEKFTPHWYVLIAKTCIVLHDGRWRTCGEWIIIISIFLTPWSFLALTGRIQTFLEMPVLPTSRIPRYYRLDLSQVLICTMGWDNDRGHRIYYIFSLCWRSLHLDELEHELFDIGNYRANFCEKLGEIVDNFFAI